jgi:hypothetical protein
MSKIHSRGFSPAATLPEEKQYFFERLPKLIEESETILADRVLYESLPGSFAHTSWPYISGDGPLCLGVLLRGWQNGVLCDRCDVCTDMVYVFSFSGSPLSGSNSYLGYCATCQAEVRQQSAGHVFMDRLHFILSHNKHQARLKYSTGG